MRIRLSDAADNDYASHYLHGLEQFGYVQTERYFEDLRKTFQRLASFPEIGRIRTEFHPPLSASIFFAPTLSFSILLMTAF
jgi:toxin ParE1/3/4